MRRLWDALTKTLTNGSIQLFEMFNIESQQVSINDNIVVVFAKSGKHLSQRPLTKYNRAKQKTKFTAIIMSIMRV
jgi:hypothetical protein